MKMYFLLYMEDTEAGSSNRVEWFPKKRSAQQAMETAYAKTVCRLRVDPAVCTESHYCVYNRSSAIIADGENHYSWSVGVREIAAADHIPELTQI